MTKGEEANACLLTPVLLNQLSVQCKSRKRNVSPEFTDLINIELVFHKQ